LIGFEFRFLATFRAVQQILTTFGSLKGRGEKLPVSDSPGFGGAYPLSSGPIGRGNDPEPGRPPHSYPVTDGRAGWTNHVQGFAGGL